jgi:hypothetical protein
MNWILRGLLIGLAVVGLSLSAERAHAVPDTADVIFVVDESGSMSGEHAFLQDVIGDLDSALAAAGVNTRNYGVVGFGGPSSGAPRDVGAISQGGGFLNATQAAAAFGDLVTSGSFEDGWNGINFALNSGNYALTAGSARNIILVTDEDRDNGNGALSAASVLADLNGASAVLNDVVNITSTTPAGALGVSSNGTAYVADGAGGFTTSPGGSVDNAAGTTITDYVDLAAATGGASWNLNQLRAGGLTAESFTAAFIAIKVQEIITPPTPTPEPATLLMLGVGLAGLGFASSRRRKLVA